MSSDTHKIVVDPISIIPGPKPSRTRRATPVANLAPSTPRRASAHRRSPVGLDGTLVSIVGMLRGGRKTFLNLVRSTAQTDLDAARFISKYDALNSFSKQNVSLEDLCTEADIKWPQLVGWAFQAAATTGQHLAAMKAALALPDVVDKSIKFAKQKDGHRDRDFLYQHTGFTPVADGTKISIVNQVAANAQAKNEGGAAFVPFEQDVIDVAPDSKADDVLQEDN